MLPVPEVTDIPSVCLNSNDVAHFHPEVFSTCAVTRARSAKAMEQVDLADPLVEHVLAEDENLFETKRKDTRGSDVKSLAGLLESSHSLDLPISRFQIIAAQKDDLSLTKCFSAVISSEAAKKRGHCILHR